MPRRVLGGRGYIAPSDMVLLAQVGCGTQAQRQVNTGMVARPDLQFVAVVDPNRDSQDYVDWSPVGNRRPDPEGSSTIPRGAKATRGIRAGRDVARQIMETWYRKQNRPPRGIRAYEDFREMLERETDIQGIVNITPDHQHGPINIAALREGQGGDLAQARRQRAARSAAHAAGRARERARRRICSPTATARIATRWRPGSRPARSARSAKSTTGRTGRSGRRACRSTTKSGPPVPDGFNWALWQGPEPDRPYHPSYTFAVYRGWYAYGTGCLGDMGHYSLWQPYRILELGVPEFVEAQARTTTRRVDEHNVSDGGHVSQVAFPKASTVRWRHPATSEAPAVDTFWYDGGMKPQTPEELVRGQRGSRRRGHAVHRRQGQDPVRLPRQQAAPDPEEAASRRSRDRSWRRTSTRRARRRVDQRDQERARNPRAASRQVAALAEAVALAGIALRVPYKRLLWDAQKTEFTNSTEATALVRRSQYRWGMGESSRPRACEPGTFVIVRTNWPVRHRPTP